MRDMSDNSVKLHFDVSGEDFTRAGEASGEIKQALKQLGFAPEVVKNVAIATYEGEINMVIHAGGGTVDVEVHPDCITVILSDEGPGIPDLDLAMQAGYSTATDTIRALGFGAGMGLPNMKNYADSLNIDTQLNVGTTITLQVFVRK